MSPLAEFIIGLGAWAWWLLGLLLLGLEILAPGMILLWFGLAALVVGAIALAIDMSWQVEVGLFVVLAPIFLVIGRQLVSRKTSDDEGDPTLNVRGSRYIGRVFVLKEPLSQGRGRLDIDDTVWRISGPDLPAGASVKIESLDGALLVVVPAEGGL